MYLISQNCKTHDPTIHENSIKSCLDRFCKIYTWYLVSNQAFGTLWKEFVQFQCNSNLHAQADVARLVGAPPCCFGTGVGSEVCWVWNFEFQLCQVNLDSWDSWKGGGVSYKANVGRCTHAGHYNKLYIYLSPLSCLGEFKVTWKESPPIWQEMPPRGNILVYSLRHEFGPGKYIFISTKEEKQHPWE